LSHGLSEPAALALDTLHYDPNCKKSQGQFWTPIVVVAESRERHVVVNSCHAAAGSFFARPPGRLALVAQGGHQRTSLCRPLCERCVVLKRCRKTSKIESDLRRNERTHLLKELARHTATRQREGV
jgi:hypothetical protein